MTSPFVVARKDFSVLFVAFGPIDLKAILLLQIYIPVSLIVAGFNINSVVHVMSFVTVVRSSNGNSVNNLQFGRSPERKRLFPELLEFFETSLCV